MRQEIERLQREAIIAEDNRRLAEASARESLLAEVRQMETKIAKGVRAYVSPIFSKFLLAEETLREFQEELKDETSLKDSNIVTQVKVVIKGKTFSSIGTSLEFSNPFSAKELSEVCKSIDKGELRISECFSRIKWNHHLEDAYDSTGDNYWHPVFLYTYEAFDFLSFELKEQEPIKAGCLLNLITGKEYVFLKPECIVTLKGKYGQKVADFNELNWDKQSLRKALAKGYFDYLWGK